MKDLTGQTFGRLTAIEPTEKRVRGSVVWRCKCECGNEVEVASSALVRGNTRSCGCMWQESGGRTKGRDLSGQRFGKLTAVKPVGKHNGSLVWECQCDCGNKKDVASYLLVGGKTRSCGCLRDEPMKKKGRADDLTGQRFGMLVAREHVGSQYRYALWRCECDCGGEVKLTSRQLKSGAHTDCGCQQRRQVKVHKHQRFGKLIALNETGDVAEGYPVWRCVCDCDRVVAIPASKLLDGAVTGCGMCD